MGDGPIVASPPCGFPPSACTSSLVGCCPIWKRCEIVAPSERARPRAFLTVRRSDPRAVAVLGWANMSEELGCSRMKSTPRQSPKSATKAMRETIRLAALT
eukprot:14215144-Alexandrium_andersonii.AAC.1